MAEHTFKFVSPDEHEAALKRLKALEDSKAKIDSAVEALKEDLKGRPTSNDLRIVLDAITSLQDMTALRVRMLGQAGSKGNTPDSQALAELQTQLNSLNQRLDIALAIADRLTKAEDRLGEQEEKHDKLLLWLQENLGISADWLSSSVLLGLKRSLDTLTGRVETVEGNLNTVTLRVDNHDAEIGTLKGRVDNHDVSIAALQQEVAEMKEQNNAPISKRPLALWMIIGLALGVIFGWAFWSWILGAIVGVGAGIVIGLIIICRSPKRARQQMVQTAPNTQPTNPTS